MKTLGPLPDRSSRGVFGSLTPGNEERISPLAVISSPPGSVPGEARRAPGPMRW